MSMDGPFRYPALLWLKLCQTERLRFSGMLVPFVCAAAAPEAGHVRLQQLQLQSVSISYQA